MPLPDMFGNPLEDAAAIARFAPRARYLAPDDDDSEQDFQLATPETAEQPLTEIPPASPSLARRAADTTIGGLAAVGNFFDLPGSMVRDVLSLQNPFDQLLTPFSDENRTTGRDMLRNMGMASKKKDTWGNFIGGIALETALDPTTYMGFGVFTKGGKVVDSLGEMKNIQRVADDIAKTKGAGKFKAPPGMRAKSAKQRLNVNQLIEHAGSGLVGEAKDRAIAAARKKYESKYVELYKTKDGIEQAFEKPLESLVSFHVPYAGAMGLGKDKGWFGEGYNFASKNPREQLEEYAKRGGEMDDAEKAAWQKAREEGQDYWNKSGADYAKLTAQSFREMLDQTAKSKDEADAIYSLNEKRAEALGESMDDFVGRKYAAVEKMPTFVDKRGGRQAWHGGKAGMIRALDDGRHVITAFEDAQDLSTLAHETFHSFATDLNDKEVGVLSKWMGIEPEKFRTDLLEMARDYDPNNADIATVRNVVYHEKLAKGFEYYLAKGKAPDAVPGLKGVFEKYKSWLASVYGSIKNILSRKLTPEMIKFYDDLFTPKGASGAPATPPPAAIPPASPNATGDVAPGPVPKEMLDQIDAELGQAAPPSPASVPPAEAASVDPSVGSVPTMVTRKMEADLLNLGYSQAEINAMRPAEAWENIKAGPRQAPAPAQSAPEIIKATDADRESVLNKLYEASIPLKRVNELERAIESAETADHLKAISDELDGGAAADTSYAKGGMDDVIDTKTKRALTQRERDLVDLFGHSEDDVRSMTPDQVKSLLREHHLERERTAVANRKVVPRVEVPVPEGMTVDLPPQRQPVASEDALTQVAKSDEVAPPRVEESPLVPQLDPIEEYMQGKGWIDPDELSANLGSGMTTKALQEMSHLQRAYTADGELRIALPGTPMTTDVMAERPRALDKIAPLPPKEKTAKDLEEDALREEARAARAEAVAEAERGGGGGVPEAKPPMPAILANLTQEQTDEIVAKLKFDAIAKGVDPDEYAQEAIKRGLEDFAKFDPERGDLAGFFRARGRDAVAEEARAASAQKRGGGMVRRSLDEVMAGWDDPAKVIEAEESLPVRKTSGVDTTFKYNPEGMTPKKLLDQFHKRLDYKALGWGSRKEALRNHYLEMTGMMHHGKAPEIIKDILKEVFPGQEEHIDELVGGMKGASKATEVNEYGLTKRQASDIRYNVSKAVPKEHVDTVAQQVMELHRLKQEMADEANEPLRQMFGTFGFGSADIMRLSNKLRTMSRADHSTIDHFDELASWMQEHYPHVVGNEGSDDLLAKAIQDGISEVDHTDSGLIREAISKLKSEGLDVLGEDDALTAAAKSAPKLVGDMADEPASPTAEQMSFGFGEDNPLITPKKQKRTPTKEEMQQMVIELSRQRDELLAKDAEEADLLEKYGAIVSSDPDRFDKQLAIEDRIVKLMNKITGKRFLSFEDVMEHLQKQTGRLSNAREVSSKVDADRLRNVLRSGDEGYLREIYTKATGDSSASASDMRNWAYKYLDDYERHLDEVDANRNNPYGSVEDEPWDMGDEAAEVVDSAKSAIESKQALPSRDTIQEALLGSRGPVSNVEERLSQKAILQQAYKVVTGKETDSMPDLQEWAFDYLHPEDRAATKSIQDIATSLKRTPEEQARLTDALAKQEQVQNAIEEAAAVRPESSALGGSIASRLQKQGQSHSSPSAEAMRLSESHRRLQNEVLGDKGPDGRYAQQASPAKSSAVSNDEFKKDAARIPVGKYFSATVRNEKGSILPDAVFYKAGEDDYVQITSHSYMPGGWLKDRIDQLNKANLPLVGKPDLAAAKKEVESLASAIEEAAAVRPKAEKEISPLDKGGSKKLHVLAQKDERIKDYGYDDINREHLVELSDGYVWRGRNVIYGDNVADAIKKLEEVTKVGESTPEVVDILEQAAKGRASDRRVSRDEIRESVGEALKRASDLAKNARAHGGSADEWFSVGQMADQLRQTGKSFTGESFHSLPKKDQIAVVRNVLEDMLKAGEVERAIGEVSGRETRQYKLAEKAAQPNKIPENNLTPEIKNDLERAATEDGINKLQAKVDQLEMDGRAGTAEHTNALDDLTKARKEIDEAGPSSGALFQEEFPGTKRDSLGFFSKAARVIADKVKGAMPYDQLIKTLRNNGVKEEEIADLGLDVFEGSKKITRKELADHIDENMVQLQETIQTEYGDELTMLSPEEMKEYRDLESASDEYVWIGDDLSPNPNRRDLSPFDRQRYLDLRNRHASASEASTQYRDYTIPGGSNHKEFLVQKGGDWRKTQDSIYSTNHFRQGNILAHIRTDDVVLPDGSKMLRVQEIQSDWHQAGRDKGYRSNLDALLEAKNRATSTQPAASRAIRKADNFGYDSILDAMRDISHYEGGDWKTIWDVSDLSKEDISAIDSWVNAVRESRSLSKGVPDAPMKKSWHNLALKRILMYAAKNGYDSVGIVHGGDIARAVGGPQEALTKFYDTKLVNEMRDLTKKYGSHQGTGNIPHSRKVDLEWKADPDGTEYYNIWHAEYDGSEYLIEQNKLHGGFSFEDDGGTSHSFRSLDEAKKFIENYVSTREYNKGFTGDFAHFEITPAMRDSINKEGFALYQDASETSSLRKNLKDFAVSRWKEVDRFLKSLPKDKAMAAAEAIDAGKAIIDNTPGVRTLKSLFNKDLYDTTSIEGNKIALQRAEAVESAIDGFRGYLGQIYEDFDRSGIFDDKALYEEVAKSEKFKGKPRADIDKKVHEIMTFRINRLFDYLEDVEGSDLGGLTHGLEGFGAMREADMTMLKPALDNMIQILGDEYTADQTAGLLYGALGDEFVRYFPAFMVKEGKSAWNPNYGDLVETIHPSMKKRNDVFRDVPGGRAVFNRISIDPVVSGQKYKQPSLKNKVDDPVFKDARQHIFENYGEELGVTDVKEISKLNGVTAWAVSLPKWHAERGISAFQNPLTAFAQRVENGIRTRYMVMSATELLADAAKVVDSGLDTYSKNFAQPYNIGDKLLSDLKINNHIIGKNIITKMGKSAEYARLVQEQAQKALKILQEEGKALRTYDGGNVVWREDGFYLRREKLNTKDVPNVEEPKAGVERGLAEAGETPEAPIKEYNERKIDQSQLGEMVVIPEADKRHGVVFRDFLSKYAVPEQMGKDIISTMKPFSDTGSVIQLRAVVEKMTNLYRAHMTGPFVPFHVRNLMGGQFMNLILKAAYDPNEKNPLTAIYRPMEEAAKLFKFKSERVLTPMGASVRATEASTIKGLARQITFPPEVMAKYGGRELTDAEATIELVREIFIKSVVGRSVGVAAEQVGALSKSLDAMRLQYPGHGRTPLQGTQNRPEFTALEASNPLGVSGGMGVSFERVGDKVSPKLVQYEEDSFLPARWGRDMSYWVEFMNRVPVYISARKRGMSMDRAAQEVNKVHFDYNGLSTFERKYMRVMWPFWTFSSRLFGTMFSELAQNPGGPMGRMIISMRHPGDQNEYVPDHIRQSLSIPVGESEDGTKSFITGFGLPIEDPMPLGQALTGDYPGAMRNVFARMNPLIKGPIEAATQRSFFYDGPFNGKELTDLDPTIGRTIANLRQIATGVKTEGRAEPFINNTFEFAVANSPLSRYATTIRTATDPRKWEQPLYAGANLLTGIRVSQVSPSAQDAVLRERMARVLKDFGGREISMPYISDNRLDRLSDEEKLQVSEVKKIINAAAKRSREINKAKASEKDH